MPADRGGSESSELIISMSEHETDSESATGLRQDPRRDFFRIEGVKPEISVKFA